MLDMKKLSLRTAANIVITILSAFIVIHLLVMTDIVSYEVVWGGKLSDHTQIVTFESVSVLITALMLAVAGIRAGYFGAGVSRKLITVVLWIMFVMFLLNTFGNFLSENTFERMAFGPATIVLALMTFRLATARFESGK